jgi:hypothetical protein
MTIALPRTFPTPKIDWTPIPPPMSLADIMAGKFRQDRPIPAKPPKPELGHKELRVLNRLTDGCTLTRVSGQWRLSSTNPGNAQAYCKIKPKIIDRLAELGHVAKWGDKVAITGKGSAFIGKGSVARIA